MKHAASDPELTPQVPRDSRMQMFLDRAQTAHDRQTSGHFDFTVFATGDSRMGEFDGDQLADVYGVDKSNILNLGCAATYIREQWYFADYNAKNHIVDLSGIHELVLVADGIDSIQWTDDTTRELVFGMTKMVRAWARQCAPDVHVTLVGTIGQADTPPASHFTEHRLDAFNARMEKAAIHQGWTWEDAPQVDWSDPNYIKDDIHLSDAGNVHYMVPLLQDAVAQEHATAAIAAAHLHGPHEMIA